MTAYKKGWLRASIAGGITSLLTLFLYLSGQPYQVNKSTFLTGLICAFPDKAILLFWMPCASKLYMKGIRQNMTVIPARIL